jgi:hypothetical protein
MAAHLELRWQRQLPLLVVLVLAAAGVVGCTSGDVRHVTMTVSPRTALLDEPVNVSVQGLPDGAPTTITATATDAGGTTWSSSARFKASSSGTVSLAQPSLGGSYTGADPMGLFNRMGPPAGSGSALFLTPRHHHDVGLRASVDGRVAAMASVRRQAPDEVGVVVRQLRPARDGIYGLVALPRRTTAKRPALLVFGGSEGGLATSVLAAGLLAAHGYPSLALTYVNPSRPGSSTPSWTLGGRPLPAVSPAAFGRPDLSAGTPQAAIPVERIRGPVLLACGELDLVWPSCANVDAVDRRLASHRFAYPVTVLRYPDAGHIVGGLNGWFGPLTDTFLEHVGGTVAGTQAAQADAHAKLLGFLASQ